MVSLVLFSSANIQKYFYTMSVNHPFVTDLYKNYSVWCGVTSKCLRLVVEGALHNAPDIVNFTNPAFPMHKGCIVSVPAPGIRGTCGE